MAARSVPAVQTVDVTKIYRVGHMDYPALRGINIKIGKGEFVSIMGPSGSGKSTLLNVVGALDRPTSGRVIIDGVDLRKLDEVTEPALIIADEPTGNLDSKTTSEVVSQFVQVNKEFGTTILVVTHNTEIANRTHHVISIRDGLIEREQYLQRIDAYSKG